MYYTNKKLILICLLTFVSLAQSTIYIFDLGGVLLYKSSYLSCKEIGLSNFFGFYNPFNLETKLMSYLDALEERSPECPQAYVGTTLMPQIMCDYLQGTISSQDIQKRINHNHKTCDFLFSTNHERELVQNIARSIFTPESLSNMFYTEKKMIKLLHHLHDQKHPSGKRKNRIFILSNWDKESFPYMVKKHPRIFSFVDGVVISGNAGFMKPDCAIFEYLFDTFSIDTANSDELILFIDDQKENIHAAKQLACASVTPLLFTSSHALKKELKTRGLW